MLFISVTSSSMTAGCGPEGVGIGGAGAPGNVWSTKEPGAGTSLHVAPAQPQVEAVPPLLSAYSK